MDFFLILSNTLDLLKSNKPDVFFLIIILLLYFSVFLFFVFCKKIFSKNKNRDLNKKKDFSQKEDPNRSKESNQKIKKRQKENLDIGFLDYMLGAKDIAHFIWIRKKINKDNRISIPLEQAIYLIRHYPEYFYYAGEKQKILFEKINRKIFEPIEKKSFDLEDKKKSSSNDLKKIELQNKSNVLVDRDGIIQAFISSEDENKKIAEKILSDFNAGALEEESENKKDDLDLKMKNFFSDQPQTNAKENKTNKDEKQTEKEEVLEEDSRLEEDQSKPMTKKEIKERIKKEKKAKEQSSISENLDIETMENIIDSIFKKTDMVAEEKNKKNNELNEKKEDTQTEIEKNKNEELDKKMNKKEKESNGQMSFEIKTPNLLFLKEKVRKENFGKNIFLLDEVLVFYKEFFEEFLKGQDSEPNQRDLLLKNLIRKFEISYDIQILTNQAVSGKYKDQNIEGKFHIIRLTKEERLSIEKNML